MSLLQPLDTAATMQRPALRESYRRTVARRMDRPGCRFLLGKLATRYARRITGDDLEIEYLHGLWTHRAGKYYFPDSETFEYLSKEFPAWKTQVNRYVADAKEYWLRHYHPKEGDVIVDVGAGRGEDTLTFSRSVGESGRVIAIEAHPLSFAILKNFCRLNGLKNVTPLHLALMDKAGDVQIVESESWMENSIVCGEAPSGAEVPAGTLDEVCRQHGINEIAFLKMNIEGAERYAVLGMTSALRGVRQACIACHDFRFQQIHGEEFRTRAFVEEFLKGYGFMVDSHPDDPRDYVRDHLWASMPGTK